MVFLGITVAPGDAQPARGGNAVSARGSDADSGAQPADTRPGVATDIGVQRFPPLVSPPAKAPPPPLVSPPAKAAPPPLVSPPAKAAAPTFVFGLLDSSGQDRSVPGAAAPVVAAGSASSSGGHDPSGPAALAANSGPSLANSGPSPAGSGGALPVAWRYAGTPPQEARAAQEVAYGARPPRPDEAQVVAYLPIRYSPKFGHFVDDRGGFDDVDLRVKKYRGCQGSGSKQRHRFLGTYFYFNEGLFSRVVVSIFKIVF